jgi:hypothetical protein
MRLASGIVCCAALIIPVIDASSAIAATKGHSVLLGKATTAVVHAQNGERKLSNLKIRPLYVDRRVKEFTTGPAHDITDRTFVVQRIYRINDSLPQETGPAQWLWQLGGWLLVDRSSGRAQPLSMPDFDPDFSFVNWFRDYAAYCGASEDGRALFAIVVEIGRRKPVLKKDLGQVTDPAPTCPAPRWERNPVRVTFEAKSAEKLVFVVKGREVENTAGDDRGED